MFVIRNTKSQVRNFLNLLVLSSFFLVQSSLAWEVDFSRRKVDFSNVQNQDRLPASVQEEIPLGLIKGMNDFSDITQDVVIMNTESGFVPNVINLKTGKQYRIHVVNINSKEKNISFVADAFSEHHNTLFAKEKTFTISPRADGIFSFQCPETAVEGKFVVSPDDRLPASTK